MTVVRSDSMHANTRPSGPLEVQCPVHPRVAGAPARRVAAPPLDVRAPTRLALVANGKPNSVEILDALAHELRSRVPHLQVRRYRKGSVSVAPEPHDVREIAEWASAVLAAVGD